MKTITSYNKTLIITLISSLLFNTLDIKSDYIKRIEKNYSDFKADIINNISNNIHIFYDDSSRIERIIRLIRLDDSTYKDNVIYKKLRILNAEKDIEKYIIDKNNQSNIVYVDKTFQKALLFGKTDGSYSLADEFDCSTALIYGKKIRPGDGKTPEGIFNISSIEPAHNKLWEGKKAYGAYFLRIQGSIGVHGNGTDTIMNQNWKKDPCYKAPEPLGIYNNNQGYGRSHGCIRLDNNVIKRLIEDSIITNKTKFIVGENVKLTNIMNKYYKR